MIAEILFPVALDKTFYYKIPQSLEKDIKPGLRIYASFANRKKVLGYVVSLKNESDITDLTGISELKEIDTIIDSKPLFILEKLLEISDFISKRWFSPSGLVLANFLRYLPLKLSSQVKEESKKESVKENNRFIVSKNPSILQKELLSEYIKDHTVIIFFPNIFSMEVFDINLTLNKELYKKYSSNQTQKERKEIVDLLLSGNIKLLLTTKSGCFLPFPDNTVFFITEPLNSSYRQFDQHPYYETVELLFKISEVMNYPVILFSTSISPFFLEKEKDGLRIEMDDIKPANIEIRDIIKKPVLSETNITEIKKLLDENKKILIVSYSKYSASIISCPVCGWIKRCPKCNSVMKAETVDGIKKYICGYCNYNEDYINICPKCHNVLQEKGVGSQRIYETLSSIFIDKKIYEIDGRCIYIKSLFDRAMDIIKNKDYDIIIGTDILLTSTLELKFDTGIFIVYERHNDFDYTYSEKFIDKFLTFSSLLNENSKLIVYTYNPENYIFNTLSDINAYLSSEIELRKNFNYPPFAYLFQIEIKSTDKKRLKELINKFIESVDENFKARYEMIEYIPNLKIRKIRNSKYYTHKAWIKIKNYNNFFNYLKRYSVENKVTVDVISY